VVDRCTDILTVFLKKSTTKSLYVVVVILRTQDMVVLPGKQFDQGAFAPVKPITRNEKPSLVISYIGCVLPLEST
jgi:hypothetical protein